MDDAVETETYCARLSRSCTGVAAGLVIFLAGICLAGWNEYRSVATLKTIAAAEAAYIDVACSPIDPANAGKLVHAACPLSNYGVFTTFAGLKNSPKEDVTGVRLVRHVQVYEWEETTSTDERNTPGGGKEKITTYSYSTTWSNTFDDSNAFTKPDKCANVYNSGRPCVNTNPATQKWWPSGPQKLGAETVGRASDLKLGDFQMPLALIDKTGAPSTPVPTCDNSTVGQLLEGVCPSYLQIVGNYMYYKNMIGRDVDLSQDFPGDVRVIYTLFNTTEASVLAQQSGSITFAPWVGPYDRAYTMYMVEDGMISAWQMLRDAEAANASLTWGLRLLSYLAAFIGLQITLAPLTVVADVIPCLGPAISGLAGSVLCCFSCLVTAFCWLLVAGFTWIAFRPAIGIPLLLLSVSAVLGAAWWKRYNDRKGTELALSQPQSIFSPMLAAAGFCPSCGAERADRGAFCPECGAKVA